MFSFWKYTVKNQKIEKNVSMITQIDKVVELFGVRKLSLGFEFFVN